MYFVPYRFWRVIGQMQMTLYLHALFYMMHKVSAIVDNTFNLQPVNSNLFSISFPKFCLANLPKYKYLNCLCSTIGSIPNHDCSTICDFSCHISDMFKIWTHLNMSYWQTWPNNPPIRWMLFFKGQDQLGTLGKLATFAC